MASTRTRGLLIIGGRRYYPIGGPPRPSRKRLSELVLTRKKHREGRIAAAERRKNHPSVQPGGNIRRNRIETRHARPERQPARAPSADGGAIELGTGDRYGDRFEPEAEIWPHENRRSGDREVVA